jgi:hypothetical protein
MPSYPKEREPVIQPLDQSIRLIPLTQGYLTIVDTADYDWLIQWSWSAAKIRNFVYALRQGNQGCKVRMHRVILGLTGKQQGDHRNHNTLDNRRSNLRVATPAQNMHNRRARCDNATGYKGVTYVDGRFIARIVVRGEYISLGRYSDPQSAALAFNDAATRYHGEFAYLNEVNNESPKRADVRQR